MNEYDVPRRYMTKTSHIPFPPPPPPVPFANESDQKGYALIEYPTLQEARAAIDGAHNTKLLDQSVNVDFAFVRPSPNAGKNGSGGPSNRIRGGGGGGGIGRRQRSRSRSPSGLRDRDD